MEIVFGLALLIAGIVGLVTGMCRHIVLLMKLLPFALIMNDRMDGTDTTLRDLVKIPPDELSKEQIQFLELKNALGYSDLLKKSVSNMGLLVISFGLISLGLTM